MSVIRFTFPSDGPSGREPLDFEIGAADGRGRPETWLVRHVRARNGAGELSSGPPKRIEYLVAADGVAAIDLDEDTKVEIRDYLTRGGAGAGEAPTRQLGRTVSLTGVVSVAVV